MVLLALQKNLEGKSNKWADELGSALWVVRTSTMGLTRETAYALVYGFEAIAPTKVALPTTRVLMYNKDVNKARRSMDLDLLEEQRIARRLRSQSFKEKTKKSS